MKKTFLQRKKKITRIKHNKLLQTITAEGENAGNTCKQ